MEPFQQAQNWLESLISESAVVSGRKSPSLKTTQQLLQSLGDIDRFFDLRIIIGGTAGKGMVATKLAATLHQAGKKVACLTSPHLQTPLERVRIGDRLVDAQTWAQSILKVRSVAEAQGLKPSYYEASFVAGVLACHEMGCEILVAEVGLGGAFDSANALRGPRIAAVTFIGDDHREILGDLPDIAATKAAIFNQDSIFNISYEKTYQAIFNKVAHGEIEYIKGIKTNLSNKMVKRITRKILGPEALFEVINVKLPARWEKVTAKSLKIKSQSHKLILDGAHSRPRFEWLIPKIKKLSSPKYAIVAMTKNHDPKAFEIIAHDFDQIIFTTLDHPHQSFHDPKDLQALFPKALVGEDVKKAFKTTSAFDPGTILVTGSFYLCGEVREWFYPTRELL